MEVWPEGLPDPLIRPYSYSDQTSVRSNNVQAGAPRYELLTSDAPSFFSVEWSMSALQFQAFEGWFKKYIVYGSKSFELDLAVGSGFQTHIVYFQNKSSPYVAKPTGKRWRIRASILAIKKIYNTDDEIDDLLELIKLNPKASFFDLLDQFANEDLPDAWENLKYGTDKS